MFSDMSLDVTDAPCSFLPVPASAAEGRGDSSGGEQGPFSRSISIEAAFEAGKDLIKEEVVSLAFLLLKNQENALQICLSVEQDRFSPGSPVGPAFLAQLVKTGKEKNLQKWHISLACALHLLGKNKQIKMLCVPSRPTSSRGSSAAKSTSTSTTSEWASLNWRITW